ncbi:Glutaredoxin 2 [groundwater metagenome]|uniref:Glutaredoxin 2 n=1 Tax=groundwater metagenome TaxID=717931 RepID=A0A098E7Y4_9ZZZZ
MSKIILYTATTCVKCPASKKILGEVVRELDLREGYDYEIKNIDEGDNMIEALQKQVAATPSILIDDELFYNGEVPKKEEILKILKEKFKK